MLGLKRRTWAILTTIAVTIALLIQTVHVWTESTAPRLAPRLLVTAMLVMTVGMVIYLFHGERPPEFYQAHGARRDDATAKANEASPRSGSLPRPG
jgi:type VI protein secretion system component VasK